MWDATEDDDAAFERRASPVLREIGERCKVIAAKARQQPHEATAAPSPAPTRQVAQAQTPDVGAPHGSTRSLLGKQQRQNEAHARGAATTVQQRMPSTASSMTNESLAEMAAFIREERAFMSEEHAQIEAKLETQRREYDAKLEAQQKELATQRQESEAKLEALREVYEAKLEAQQKQSEAKLEAQQKQSEAKLEALREEVYEAKREAQQKQSEAKLEAQKQAYETKLVSDAKLEGLQERLDALHQAKLLTDDEISALENKIADFIDCRSSIMVAPTAISVAVESVRKLVGMCEGVSKDGMLARQLRQRYL